MSEIDQETLQNFIKELNANGFKLNGSEISDETLDLIKELSKNHNIIVFTDPDYPGERIRKKIAHTLHSPFLNSFPIST